MAKTTKKTAEKTVAPVAAVVDNVITPTTEVITVTEAPISKAQQALAIFNEESVAGEDKLRARVIARFKADLGMSAAGASTYFQNAKKLAAGGKVKHYYKPKTEKPTVDNSGDAVPESFEVKLLDGEIKVFLSQLDADNFIESNPSIVDPDQSVEEEQEAA